MVDVGQEVKTGPSVIDRLLFIRAGQSVGLALADLGEVLRIRDQGEAPCRHVTDLIEARIREVDERIEDLRRLCSNLVGLAATASDFDPGLCPPDSVCRILTADR